MSSSPQESNEEEAKGSRLFAALREKAQADLDAEAHQVPRAHPLEAVVIGVLVSASLLMCAYNVIVRYFVPNLVFDFVDEVQVYLIIWAVFLSLGSLTLMDRHVKSDFFVNMFPVAIQQVITRSVEVITEGRLLIRPTTSVMSQQPCCVRRFGFISLPYRPVHL
ncbi:MAG: hypothetical protein RL585_1083 [Pseudomonadota bacterium]